MNFHSSTLSWAKNNTLKMALILTLVVMATILFFTPFTGASASPIQVAASATAHPDM